MKKSELFWNVLSSPLLSIITHWSGLSGNYLRYSFYKKKLKNLGSGSIIDEGVIITEPEKVSIGQRTHVDKYVIILGKVEIGNYVHIAQNCLLQGGSSVKIGDYVGIASGSKIYSATDTIYDGKRIGPMIPPKYRNPLFKSPVVIEKDVFIGAGCIILPNVRIGEGAVVGAGSLVLKDIPSWKIAVGSPAKPIKDRPRIVI